MNARLFVYALTTACLLIWSAEIYFNQNARLAATAAVEETQVKALIAPLAQKPFHLDPQQKTTGCRVNGPLPDHSCTPGAIFATATPEIICVSGYTQTVRNVSTALKKKLYAAYGIAYPQATGSYELDHLIPLELGGSNSSANLFPEAAAPAPGFHEKDLVENYLHNEVCAGQLPLSAAQEQIASNWLAVYASLSPETIASLKAQYRSWTTEPN